jgi:hypothetical protein
MGIGLAKGLTAKGAGEGITSIKRFIDPSTIEKVLHPLTPNKNVMFRTDIEPEYLGYAGKALNLVPGYGDSALKATKHIWSTPAGGLTDIGLFAVGSAMAAKKVINSYPKIETAAMRGLENSKLNNSKLMRRAARSLERQTYINLKDNPGFSNKILQSATSPVGTVESNIASVALKGLLGLGVPVIPFSPIYMSAGQQAKTLSKRVLSPMMKKTRDFKVTREAKSIPLADTATEHLRRRRWLVEDLKKITAKQELDKEMRSSVGLKKIKYFYNKGNAPTTPDPTPYDNIVTKEVDPNDIFVKLRGLADSYKKGQDYVGLKPKRTLASMLKPKRDMIVF